MVSFYVHLDASSLYTINAKYTWTRSIMCKGPSPHPPHTITRRDGSTLHVHPPQKRRVNMRAHLSFPLMQREPRERRGGWIGLFHTQEPQVSSFSPPNHLDYQVSILHTHPMETVGESINICHVGIQFYVPNHPSSIIFPSFSPNPFPSSSSISPSALVFIIIQF